MQFGKALLGAIIGAGVGIVLLIVVYLTIRSSIRLWLSIPLLLVTGLGVRMFVATTRPRQLPARCADDGSSPWRPILAAGWSWRRLSRPRPTSPSSKVPVVTTAKPADEPGDADAKDAERRMTKDETRTPKARMPKTDADAAPRCQLPAARPSHARRIPQCSVATTPRRSRLHAVGYYLPGVAALVAYELGRGSGDAGAVRSNCVDQLAGSDASGRVIVRRQLGSACNRSSRRRDCSTLRRNCPV